MNLLDQASSDVQAILSDPEGFGLQMTVTAPDGSSASITGFAADIGHQIDPDTGVAVSGRTVQASLPLRELDTIGQPTGIVDSSSKPWLITMRLPQAQAEETFKVVRTMPDRIGVLVCLLEEYQSFTFT